MNPRMNGGLGQPAIFITTPIAPNPNTIGTASQLFMLMNAVKIEMGMMMPPIKGYGTNDSLASCPVNRMPSIVTMRFPIPSVTTSVTTSSGL